MQSPNLRIWRYRLVRHSITCWRTKLCRVLAPWYLERTESCFLWKSGENSTTDAICFVVSCVTETKPLHSLVLHKVLECQLHSWLLQERLQGRVWEPKLLNFSAEARSSGDRSSGSTVILIIFVISTLMLTLYFRRFLKNAIWLSFHLK